jgi:RES domain-containing protein
LPDKKNLSQEEEELLWGLEEALSADIDSWYTSSLACCDACFDEYVAKWPLAYTKEDGLQYTQTPADAFYSGSRRVQSLVTEKQFEKLLPYIECPNCGGPLGPNLFSVELPFDPEVFEEDLRSLGALAKTAPFLLLTNKFARQIRSEIENLCSEINPDRPEGEFYRGRVLQLRTAHRRDFGPPPATDTKEGRYNHAGRPALYLANNRTTCWEECRRPQTDFFVASFGFRRPIKILDLSAPEEMTKVMAALMYSNLTSAPSDRNGWDRPEYVLTRFVGDCARMAGVDAIQYLSTRVGSGTNLALLDGTRYSKFLRLLRFENYVQR